MVLTVSKWFHFASAVAFFVSAIVAAVQAGDTLNVTTLALIALGMWQVAEATK